MDLITLAMAKKYTEKRVAEIGGESPSGVQADWNQNDETTPDYIKNRPFGETYTIDKTSIWETTVTTTEYSQEGKTRATITFPRYYSGGNNGVINVEINGVKYITSYQASSTGETIGNGDLSGYYRGHNSEQPFAISNGYGGSYFHTTLGIGTYTIKMYVIKKELVTLDSKFLPNWFPNIDYNDTATLLDNAKVYNGKKLDFALFDNSNYTIIFDDVEYQCSSETLYLDQEYGSIIYIGNLYFQYNGFAEDNGLPFLIIHYPDYGKTTHCCTSNDYDSQETHTMSVVGKGEVITHIDEKFIPDTIARVNEVGYIAAKNAPIMTAIYDCKELCNLDENASNNDFYVAYGNGKYVLFYTNYDEEVANEAFPNDEAFYSDDGVNWNKITMPESLIWRDVIFNNGVFVLNGLTRYLSGSTRLYHSVDGINWELSNIEGSSSNYLSGEYVLSYLNNKFIVMNSKNLCAASDDGITFYDIDSPNIKYYNLKNIVYGNEVHICFEDRNIKYSADRCTTWENVKSLNSMNYYTCFGNDKFVALSGDELSRSVEGIIYSYNGVDWFNGSMTKELGSKFDSNNSYKISFVTYINGMFIAHEEYTKVLMYSLDGITWDLTYDKILSEEPFWYQIHPVKSDNKNIICAIQRLPEEDYKLKAIIYELTAGNPYDIANVSYVDNKFATKEEVATMAILTSPNGTKYKLAVSDDGTLSAIPVE